MTTLRSRGPGVLAVLLPAAGLCLLAVPGAHRAVLTLAGTAAVVTVVAVATRIRLLGSLATVLLTSTVVLAAVLDDDAADLASLLAAAALLLLVVAGLDVAERPPEPTGTRLVASAPAWRRLGLPAAALGGGALVHLLATADTAASVPLVLLGLVALAAALAVAARSH